MGNEWIKYKWKKRIQRCTEERNGSVDDDTAATAIITTTNALPEWLMTHSHNLRAYHQRNAVATIRYSRILSFIANISSKNAAFTLERKKSLADDKNGICQLIMRWKWIKILDEKETEKTIKLHPVLVTCQPLVIRKYA